MQDWLEDFEQDMDFMAKKMTSKQQQAKRKKLVEDSNKILAEYLNAKGGPTLFD
jgi:hypothetical protein